MSDDRISWLTAKYLFKIGVPQIAEFYWDIDNDYEEICPEEFAQNPDWCDGKMRNKSLFILDEHGIPEYIGKGLYAAFTEEELIAALKKMLTHSHNS